MERCECAQFKFIAQGLSRLYDYRFSLWHSGHKSELYTSHWVPQSKQSNAADKQGPEQV